MTSKHLEVSARVQKLQQKPSVPPIQLSHHSKINSFPAGKTVICETHTHTYTLTRRKKSREICQSSAVVPSYDLQIEYPCSKQWSCVGISPAWRLCVQGCEAGECCFLWEVRGNRDLRESSPVDAHSRPGPLQDHTTVTDKTVPGSKWIEPTSVWHILRHRNILMFQARVNSFQSVSIRLPVRPAMSQQSPQLIQLLADISLRRQTEILGEDSWHRVITSLPSRLNTKEYCNCSDLSCSAWEEKSYNIGVTASLQPTSRTLSFMTNKFHTAAISI